MADFAKRPEVTVSTMGKVNNPTGEGVAAVSSTVKAKARLQIDAAAGTTSTTTPPPSPTRRSSPPSNNHHHSHLKNEHESKVKDEGSAGRNITRKKGDGAVAGGHYNSKNKKQGGAGKGKWTAAVDGSDAEVLLDENDPLYDDIEEAVDGSYVLVSAGENGVESNGVKRPNGYDPLANKAVYGPMLTLPEFKIRITEALQEYCDSADFEEIIRCIRELNCPQYHSVIVKRAVVISLDKSSREKELISRLFSMLHPSPLSDKDIGEGFTLLLDSLDDLSIDAPDAKNIVSTFLARAVMDEVLPPAFLRDGHPEQPEVIEKAMRLLSREHCGVILEHAWGPGDGRPVPELKTVIDQLIKEYLLSRELDEAAHCIREMNSPHFHHEIVKRGFTIALEERGDSSPASNMDAIAALLAFLVENAIVSSMQVSKGMHRLHSCLGDLKLDVSPKAPEMLGDFERMLKASGALG